MRNIWQRSAAKRATIVGLSIGLALALGGCALLGGAQSAEGEDADAILVLPTATPLALAPTLPVETPIPPTPTPTPTEEPTPTSQAPTPLPEPTRIGATTATPGGDEAGGSQASGAPGISIRPQLGEPGDIVMVDGSGFKPGVPVTLHWAAPDGETGPVYYEIETDERGNFQVGLIVLPADRWPGGPPAERDVLQLRALAEELAGHYYYADFTHIPRVGQTTLVLTYTNAKYGYEVTVPNGWEWDWQGDDPVNVRFESGSGSGSGFVRVLSGTDVTAIIQRVMGEEFPGEGYTTGNMTTGSYPGTQVTANNGRVVQFIPSGGRTYALSFTNDNGQFSLAIAGSFKLK